MLQQIESGAIVAEVVGNWTLTWIGNATISPLSTTAKILSQSYSKASNTGVALVSMPAGERNLSLNFFTNNQGVTNLTVILIFLV